jgi:hypothetical protein
MRLNTHFQLVQRLSMNGAVPPVLLYTFMVYTEMTLPSGRMDVLCSGCTKLFNVCLTEYDLRIFLCIVLVQVGPGVA